MAEAFRALATNLRFSGAGNQLKSLVITSAGPGEGKSMVAANLAAAFAQSGRRVILVDADMRRPTVHKRNQLPNSVGLSSLIIADNATDSATLERFLQQGPVPSLRILTSGPIPPNPAELLSLPWAPDVFDALESQADLVIWDTPPALTVTDAVILAERVDATLQVVRAGQTRRDLIVKTREALSRVGANVLPPVLNRVKARDVGYYQYYYYRYGRDGEGYSQREEKTSPQAGTVDSTTAQNGLEGQPQEIKSNGESEPTRERRGRRRSSNPLQR
jgi:protein-tyrosine kinase